MSVLLLKMGYFMNKRVDIYQTWVAISFWQVYEMVMFGDLDSILRS